MKRIPLIALVALPLIAIMTSCQMISLADVPLIGGTCHQGHEVEMAKCYARVGMKDLSLTERACEQQGIHVDHDLLMKTLASERALNCRNPKAAFEIAYRFSRNACSSEEGGTGEALEDAKKAHSEIYDRDQQYKNAQDVRDDERKNGRSFWSYIFPSPSAEDYLQRARPHDEEFHKILAKYGADESDVNAQVTCLP